MSRRIDETPTLPILRISAAIGIALVAIVAVPATMSLGLAQDASDSVAPASEPDGEGAEAQRKRIQDEIATLKQHPWAGNYYEGDGLGANIRMTFAPSTGVAATWHGCMGLYGANRGKIVVDADGQLRFAYETPNEATFGGFPDTVRPVRWGQRRYMIPDDRMIAFVNAIHHGFEPRDDMHGMFLLADGDEKRPVAGLPDLPKPMLDLIRRQPLEARIVSIDGVDKRKDEYGCGFTYRMTFDRGEDDGLAPGVELKTTRSSRAWETVTIKAVAHRTATAEMGVWPDDCVNPKTVPKPGWRFTTGAYAG